jgi:PleD family two-component response regulator
LLKFADKSLYVSKSNGRKRVSLHTFYEWRTLL